MSILRLFVLPAAMLIGLGASALAEDAPVDIHVPVPKSRPKDPKASPPAAAPGTTPKPALSAADAVHHANAWFDSAQTLIANFVQVGPDGHRAEGKLSLLRPGRMLFKFSPPDRLEIVADGRSVAVRDQKMNTQDLYLIGQTPLKFLLADHIDLAKDTQVLNVEQNDNAVTILIEDKATLGGSAQIELLFDPTSFALKQWTVNDAQGAQTVVTLFDIDLATKPDESQFKIDEFRPIGPKR